MRHNYIAQFYTTYIYNFIFEGHIYSYTRIRFEPAFKTSQEWVCLTYCRVTTVQLYHLDSTLCKGSWWLLPSFCDLTFLDKTVLRDTRWWDALGKLYVV